jgi:protein TonB
MAGPARTLDYAVLASLALHGLLLFGISTVDESKHRRASAPEPIAVRLAEPEPVLKSILPKTISRKSISKPARVPEPAPVEEAVAESKPVPVPAPATPPVAVQVTAEPPADAATLGQYRVQLISAARRFKRYPALARENNWSGNVVVAVTVGADGRPDASVRKSSGRPVLDQQALEMFRQAVREVPVPPALRGREFSLEVRAIYGLED